MRAIGVGLLAFPFLMVMFEMCCRKDPVYVYVTARDTVEVAIVHDSTRVETFRLMDSTVHVDGLTVGVWRKK